MVGSLGAQVGLVAFAVAIVAGLSAGNSAITVLSRALLAMVGAILIAQLAGYCLKLVLRDHLQRRKSAIDQAHVAALAARQAGAVQAAAALKPDAS